MGGSGKPRWKISFHRNNSSTSKLQSKDPPLEFLCPISGSLIAEPVVVASGHTFESVSVQVCRDLGFSPNLIDGSTPDFSAVIPNLALKSTISSWCVNSGVEKPNPPEYSSVERLVRTTMASARENQDSDRELLKAVPDNPPVIFSHAATELGPRVNPFKTSSSESGIASGCHETPLPLTTRPTCYLSSSLEISESEQQNQNPNGTISEEEEKLTVKLRSDEASEQEEAVISLRNITKTREDTRISLCSPVLLSSLRSLISSENRVVQVNAVASLVNFSLARSNKVKIVRSGFIPTLIQILKTGFTEAQEHAAGAIFSLALDDENKMAIGVLGALEPLMNALRSESERTRHDSALALYHLTLVQSNRVKLVKLGVVTTLLTMVKLRDLASRVLMILCNVAAATEGRTAMLDANAVECLVGVLRETVAAAAEEATVEHCVAALYGVSSGGLRFKALAKEAKAVEVLREVEERGTERAREKAKRMLQMMRGGQEEDGDGVGSGRVLGPGRTRIRVGGGRDVHAANTTTF